MNNLRDIITEYKNIRNEERRTLFLEEIAILHKKLDEYDQQTSIVLQNMCDHSDTYLSRENVVTNWPQLRICRTCQKTLEMISGPKS